MAGDIDNLIKLIKDHFVFDEKNYPELTGASEQGKLNFAVRHSALHFAKTAGKIAAVSEHVDHNGEMDTHALRENVSKTLINTLRLAELVGMTEKDITEAIQKNITNE